MYLSSFPPMFGLHKTLVRGMIWLASSTSCHVRETVTDLGTIPIDMIMIMIHQNCVALVIFVNNGGDVTHCPQCPHTAAAFGRSATWICMHAVDCGTRRPSNTITPVHGEHHRHSLPRVERRSGTDMTMASPHVLASTQHLSGWHAHGLLFTKRHATVICPWETAGKSRNHRSWRRGLSRPNPPDSRLVSG